MINRINNIKNEIEILTGYFESSSNNKEKYEIVSLIMNLDRLIKKLEVA